MRSDHRTADQPAISFLLNDRPHYQCGAKHEQYQVGQPKRHRLALNDAVPAIIAVPFLFLGSHRSPKPPALALLALALRHETVFRCAVCTENLILFDYVTESPNVNGDDRAALLPPDPVRLAIQVEEST